MKHSMPLENIFYVTVIIYKLIDVLFVSKQVFVIHISASASSDDTDNRDAAGIVKMRHYVFSRHTPSSWR